jgi:biopolymer transport protein ExbD
MAFDLGQSGGRSKKPRPVPVMNVTPLVDIALVVLIIFMLIVPMMEKSFWLNLPKKAEEDKNKPHEPDQDEGPLVLTVDSKGVIRVNKTVLKKSEFPQRLPRMIAAQPLPVVYFDASDEVSYGQAVEVMDLAKQNGAKAVAMLTDKVAK